jgi:sterol desaturase/sphingolipid hydroxylase (fatty acid hydroxylase superfamily)
MLSHSCRLSLFLVFQPFSSVLSSRQHPCAFYIKQNRRKKKTQLKIALEIFLPGGIIVAIWLLLAALIAWLILRD